jgi:hypothetical protein
LDKAGVAGDHDPAMYTRPGATSCALTTTPSFHAASTCSVSARRPGGP